jgi:hypothetical protein
MVKDDESGIDLDHPGIGCHHIVSVGVAPGSVVRLIQRDVVAALQKIGRRESGHTRPHDSHSLTRRRAGTATRHRDTLRSGEVIMGDYFSAKIRECRSGQHR